MKRLVYSIYIDIPKDLLDPQPPHHGETEDKNVKAKRQFAEHYPWLLQKQMEYAAAIGAEYRHFTYDDKYQKLREWYNETYPFITEYNIVNFYKIHLMYELAEQYDEILYLDLDVLPVTKENFFEAHDLSKGIAIKKNSHGMSMNKDFIKHREDLYERKGEAGGSIRSPMAKWWNSKALCLEYGNPIEDIPVYNTGIVGFNKYWLDKLGFFEDFEETLYDMKELCEDEHTMYPKFAQALFGYDNETIWGFKAHMNDVPSIWLDGRWHTFLDKMTIIPSKSKLVHIINKSFDEVRDWYEKNNL
jgi:hypothetical protein